MRSIINFGKDESRSTGVKSNSVINDPEVSEGSVDVSNPVPVPVQDASPVPSGIGNIGNVRISSIDLNCIAMTSALEPERETSKDSSLEDLPPIVLSRRSEHADAPSINKLIKVPQTTQLFGPVNVHDMIEHAYYSLSQVDKKGKVVAHVALFDYPNVNAVPSTHWLKWLKRMYKLERATVRNTLFVHLMVWNVRYSNEFLELMLNTVFINNTYLQHIVIVVPPDAPTYDIFEEYFQRLLPCDYFEADIDITYNLGRLQTLLLCMRQPHVPRLKIRRAAQEDNDDIVPMLHKLAGNLTTLYGEFYLAEMVAYPNERRQIIVAEKEDHAIGVMSMHVDINYDLLNEQYELASFYGLRQYDERDRIALPELYHHDSREGLNLPMVIQSDESLSRLSQLSTLYEGVSGASSASICSKLEEALLTGSTTVSEDEDDDIEIVQDDMSGSSMFLSRYYSDANNTTYSVAQLSTSPIKTITLTGELTSRIRNNSMSDIPAAIGVSTLLLGKSDKTQNLKIPTYYGAPNAFAVELFAMRDDEDERYAFDFLEAAFECFPDLDYCIIALPASDPVFSLLNHFTRVPPRPSKAFNRELYVAHRNSIVSELMVRNGTRLDQTAIQLLLNRIDKREAIQVDFQASVNYEDSDFKSYVITSEESIVGLAIMSVETDLDYLRTHYDIEAYTKIELHKSGHGILKHFVLSPLFHRHSKYFLKEIHRLSGMSCMYFSMYCRDPADLDQFIGRSMITCIGEMLPISPRRQIEYNLPSLGENCPNDNILRKEIPFALYHMNRRYTSQPKMDINARIVVIGASDTSLAFLEALLFRPSCSYLTFNNVTLVSPHGLPGDIYPHVARDMLIPYHGRYNSQYMARVNFRTYVNLVYGILTAINRTSKYVVINDEAVLHYEYLLLFCGEQFQKPAKLTTKNTTELGLCHHHMREATMEDSDEFPLNIFLINTELDAANALAALKRFKVLSQDTPIIIYGSCINAYCCVAALIEFGITGQLITFVECFPIDPHAVAYFNDSEVDEAAMAAIKAEGVKWYTGYYFSEWQLDPQTNRIVRVTFESKTKSVTLDCLAMFCYGNKTISTRTFTALSSAALVYDGRLVIDANYQTSDPSIIAAGSLTKYKRCYYADKMRHSYYNAIEIGSMVGEMFRRRLDPCSPEEDEDEGNMRERRDSTQPTSIQANMLTPLFTMPLVTSCRLAGGFNYLHVRRPGPVAPLEADMSREDYGQVLLTGNWKTADDPRHFRLHLNIFNVVETITCYTKQDIEVDNLISLYGKHERLLNNLVLRFDMGYIRDFYEYFREPWTCALFHDRFSQLQNVCRVDLLTAVDMPGKPLVEVMLDEFNKNSWKKMTDAEKGLIEQKYTKLGYERLIERLLCYFIDHNHAHLPMYATPKVVQRMLKGAKESPLFAID